MRALDRPRRLRTCHARIERRYLGHPVCRSDRWLAGKIVRGTGFGLVGDIVIGVLGALVASLIFPRLGIRIGTGLVSEIVYSALGAIILLLVVRLVRTGGRL